jgi:hypothetical protein
VVKDDVTRQGLFDLMDELEMIGKAVSIKFSSCTVINTGDLLEGKTGATRHEILDAMIAHWMSYPVHGTKTGYSKLAMKLAEGVEADLVPKIPAKRTTSKKRAASGSSSSSFSSSSHNGRGRGGADHGRRDSASYTYSPGSHPNHRGGWIPNFTRGGHRGGGFGGRGHARNFNTS